MVAKKWQSKAVQVLVTTSGQQEVLLMDRHVEIQFQRKDLDVVTQVDGFTSRGYINPVGLARCRSLAENPLRTMAIHA